MPRRRCVGATPTIVTPAAATGRPPGTVTRKVNAPEVPTTSDPSHTASERSGSVSRLYNSRSSGASGTPPKASSSTLYH
ncbi:hypothetical protein B590_21537 [Streptomyces sp. PVA_94-07]|nr:hypothetical protein B590_21537 [Streptomyces sp. PVA_94-07]